MEIPSISPEQGANAITAGTTVVGLAGFADSAATLYWGVDLGIRDFLPDPVDLPDHGMSMAVAAHLSEWRWRKNPYRGGNIDDLSNVFNPDITQQERRESTGRLRKVLSRTAIAGIAAGSLYVGVGEVGSEVMHIVHEERQQDMPEEDRTRLPLGRFDLLDLAYGVGAAVAVSKLHQKEHTRTLDIADALTDADLEYLSQRQLEEGFRPGDAVDNETVKKTPPRASKRYTPPGTQPKSTGKKKRKK